MANDKWLNEIADQLREHSSEVNPQLWQGISSQIGSAGSSGAVGALGFAKIAAIVGISASAIGLTYFLTKERNDVGFGEKVKVSLVEETSKEIVNVKKEVVKSEVFLDEKQNVKREILDETNVVSNVDVQSEVLVIAEPFGAEILTPKVAEPILVKRNNSKISYKEDASLEKTVDMIVDSKSSDYTKLVNTHKQENSYNFSSLPNVFTPNGDGANDYFFVESDGLKNYSLVVLDSKNKLVWKTSNPNEKWDGRNLSGDILDKGSYIYYITAEDEKGNSVNKFQRLEIR